MKDQNYDKDTDTELLSRYLDSELDSEQSLALKRRLLAEPALRANLDRLQRVTTRVHRAFNQPGADSVPQQTRELLEQATVLAPTHAEGSQRRAFLSFAVAATIAVAAGVMLVPQWGADSSLNPGSSQSVDLQLSQVLESTPSLSDGWAQLDDGRAVRPVLSFKARSGAWCREFIVQNDSTAERGIACRSNQDWSIEVLAATEVPGSVNEYRPAGSNAEEAVTQYVADNAAGIALAREEEAELIATEWR